MKQGIVVCTWSGGLNWASLCIESLIPIYKKYPFYLVVNDADNADKNWIAGMSNFMNVLLLKSDSRELGAIKSILKNTDLDEFWLFQDTVEILDTAFIEDTFINHQNKSASYMLNFMQFYLGKWKTDVLRSMNIPHPKDKMEAIRYEHSFANAYMEADSGEKICIDPLIGYDNKRSNYIDTMFGEERFAVVGKFLIKRISVVNENFRADDGSNSFLPNEEIEKWRQKWRVMVYR